MIKATKNNKTIKSEVEFGTKIDNDDFKDASSSSLPRQHFYQIRTSAKNAENNPTDQQSKIPRKEKTAMNGEKSIQSKVAPPEDKKFSLRSPSKSTEPKSPQSAREPLIKSAKGHLSSPRTCNKPPTSAASSATLKSSMATVRGASSFIRNGSKTNTADLGLNSKLRSFTTKKNKLRDAQTEFLKFCDMNKDVLSEEYKLVSLVKNGESKLVIGEGDHILKISKMQGVKEPDNHSLKEFKEKLKTTSDEELKICQDLLMKLESLQMCSEDQTAGDSIKLKQDIKDMRLKFELDFKEKHNQLGEIMQYIDNIALPSLNRKIEENLKVDAAQAQKKITELNDQIETYRKKVDTFEKKITDWKAKEASTTNKYQSELSEKNDLISKKEKEISKLQLELVNLETKKNENTADHENHGDIIATLKAELEESKIRIERDSSMVDEMCNEKNKFKVILHQKEEIEKLYMDQKNIATRLQDEIDGKELSLKRALDDLENFKRASVQGAGDHSNYEAELYNENEHLKHKIEILLSEKCAIELERDVMNVQLANFESMEKDLFKSRDEIADQMAMNEKLRDRLELLEINLQNKVKIINELEQKNLNHSSKDLQEEVVHLRKTDKDKTVQIQNLNMQLNKANMEIKQCNESIEMHKRVLKIRSELISSMQDKEKTDHFRLNDLYSEITKHSTIINQDNAQLNFELTSKAEELQNLFTTVGSKQMEISRQEHIIKMLEEELERSKKLRLRQSVKIDHLKDELSRTREALSTYEQNLLKINDFNRQQLYEENNLKPVEQVEMPHHYETDRRRKRQIDIQVKKIEK